MLPPAQNPGPVGQRPRLPGSTYMVERTTHLDTVLPAGGLFTNQALQDLPAGLKQLVLLVTYTRGGVGGRPLFDIEWGTDVDTTSGHHELIRDLTQFAAAGAIGQSPMFIEQNFGPTPQSNSPLKYLLQYVVPYGITKFRLIVAENGNVGAPGTIKIEFVGGTGEG